MAESEVARLRRQIELECEALERMAYGFAAVASHAAIMRKYRRIGACQEELAQFVGEKESIEIMTDVYNGIVK
jgi:hypothetical protein